MADTVVSARAAGIYKPFHVFADRIIDGCECYDAMGSDEYEGFAPFIYLKAGVTKLPCDCYVWIEPGTRFRFPPLNLVEACGRSPIHVPLESDLASVADDVRLHGMLASQYRAVLGSGGVSGAVFFSSAFFWIIRAVAVDLVCRLVFEFKNSTKAKGDQVSSPMALGYAMQMLCADKAAHTIERRSDLWMPGYVGYSTANDPFSVGRWPLPYSRQTVSASPSLYYPVPVKSAKGCLCQQ
jgi:hypothetical protein